jgi:Zinc finger, C2H2 type/Zinc-finger of C2H2 type
MCDKKFAVRTSIWKHKKLKHGIINPSYQDESPEVINSSKISCTICKIAFSDKKAYYRHRKTVHRQNGQTCKICNKTFTSANSSYELYDHLKSAHAKELLGYNNSDENFNGSHNSSQQVSDEEGEVEDVYEDDVQQMNVSSKYSCGVCGNNFPGMIALRTHKCPAATKVISQDTYDCEICHKSYTSISALKSHRGWHLRSPDGKAAFSNSGLWMPQNKVTHKVSKHEVLDAVPVKQPILNVVPNSSIALNHLQLKKKLPPDVQLSIVKKKKPNDEVPMASSPRNELRDQPIVSTSASKQVALSEGRFCLQCDREFTKKAAYFRHMEEVHRPNSVFCPVCNKSFTRKSTLLVHMKKHETDSAADSSSALMEECDESEDEQMEIVYNCDLCNVQFPNASLYKKHCVKQHDVSEDDIVDDSPPGQQDIGSRQKCEQCGDHFRTEAEMWSHLHYTCDTCGQHFSTPSKLSHHARKHRDQEKMFLPCNICDRFYMNEQSLQKHMELSH